MKHVPLFHEIDTRFQYPFGHVSTQCFRVFYAEMKARILTLSVLTFKKPKLVTEVRRSAVRSENGKKFTLFDKSFKNFISIVTCRIINREFKLRVIRQTANARQRK